MIMITNEYFSIFKQKKINILGFKIFILGIKTHRYAVLCSIFIFILLSQAP